MDLYYLPASAPCRAVQMTAAALGLELNLIHTSLDKNEHMTPAFLKLNPEHTIPTLVDNSFSLWESRAIIIYLVDKYAKNDALYPKDPKTRAVINQRLFFDMDTIYESFAEYYYPQIFESKPADPEKFKAMEEAIGFLEIFLTGNEYVAGDTMSIADFSLLASISTFDVAKFDLSSYTNVSRWYELCKKTVPGWEVNFAGIQQMSSYFEKISQ